MFSLTKENVGLNKNLLYFKELCNGISEGNIPDVLEDPSCADIRCAQKMKIDI
ncbi:hypothetical protein GCM10009430_06970 [Aquimarina litoralis]|uniref:Uncharacterized protein n=1 Tax=Aquimarina litoralis TaxID=584605 RepID=A0ABP3TP17_9FLAO